MRKFFSAHRLQALITSVVFLGAVSSSASASDRFSLAVGHHGDLIVFGPQGEKVADLPVPSISQPVSINGTTSFNVSYGRDVNDMLTAIIAPNSTQPANLHFDVLGKKIDADKQAVVTLTFSRNLDNVRVDPGYVGLVQVDSEQVRHHELADESYPPAPSPTPVYQPVSTYPPPAPLMNTEVAPRALPPPTRSSTLASNYSDDPTAEEEVRDTTSTSESYHSGAPYASTAAAPAKLFWSEPVTAPNGSYPHVASDEMKLVEVQGPVSVRWANGEVRTGTDGMILPSGAVVSTQEGASAAVFIGGVNSERLLPNTDASFSQYMTGSVRHTTVNLTRGAVFSRVGRRSGETQRFEVRTPQGVTEAKGTEFLDIWDGGHHYVFVEKGSIDLFVDGRLVGVVHGHGGSDIGMISAPPTGDLDHVLREYLTELQPFNLKTNEVRRHIDEGVANSDEIAYYTAALYSALISEGYPHGVNTYIAAQIGSSVIVALHDLLPFETASMTPH